MGAREALTFLDALDRHRLLSRRTTAQYILPTLYGGRETREGTQGHQVIEERLFGEVSEEMLGRRVAVADDPRERAVSREAAVYLRSILATASGDRRQGMALRGLGDDSFSDTSYREVLSLLGTTGTKYLGIRGRHGSIVPSPSRIAAIAIDEELEGTPYLARSYGPPGGVDTLGGDPMIQEFRTYADEFERFLETELQTEIEEANGLSGGNDAEHSDINRNTSRSTGDG